MRNLSEVARLARCSRAALGKFLVNFRDTYGFGLIAGKLQGSVLLTAKANCVRSETAPIPVSVGKMQKQYNPIKWS
jgi:hypothetical protein